MDDRGVSMDAYDLNEKIGHTEIVLPNLMGELQQSYSYVYDSSKTVKLVGNDRVAPGTFENTEFKDCFILPDITPRYPWDTYVGWAPADMCSEDAHVDWSYVLPAGLSVCPSVRMTELSPAFMADVYRVDDNADPVIRIVLSGYNDASEVTADLTALIDKTCHVAGLVDSAKQVGKVNYQMTASIVSKMIMANSFTEVKNSWGVSLCTVDSGVDSVVFEKHDEHVLKRTEGGYVYKVYERSSSFDFIVTPVVANNTLKCTFSRSLPALAWNKDTVSVLEIRLKSVNFL